MIRPVIHSEIRDAVADASTILIATDVDGTVCTLSDPTHQLDAPPRALSILQRLSGIRDLEVALLSSRSAVDLQSLLQMDVVYSGNHGLEICGRGLDFVHPEASRLEPRLKSICEELRNALARWPGAWVEDKRVTATVHIRACPSVEWTSIRDAIRTIVRPVDDIFLLRNGRAAFEIAPRTGWDKGSALNYIQRELQLDDALTVCIGGDETDEAMFQAFPGGISIRVAPDGDTDAMYSLEDSAAVLNLFEWIAETVRAPRQRTFASGFGAQRPVFT